MGDDPLQVLEPEAVPAADIHIETVRVIIILTHMCINQLVERE